MTVCENAIVTFLKYINIVYSFVVSFFGNKSAKTLALFLFINISTNDFNAVTISISQDKSKNIKWKNIVQDRVIVSNNFDEIMIVSMRVSFSFN